MGKIITYYVDASCVLCTGVGSDSDWSAPAGPQSRQHLAFSDLILQAQHRVNTNHAAYASRTPQEQSDIDEIYLSSFTSIYICA